MRERNEDGFTFVETLIALAIILIMSAGVGFSAAKAIDRARVASCRTQISAFKVALESYYLDCGSYPTDGQGLRSLWEKPSLEPVPDAWSGPYLDREVPRDPWGGEYRYSAPGAHGLAFAIASDGPDGIKGDIEGGIDETDDIVSWK